MEQENATSKFTVGGFYGVRHKRKCLGIERAVDQVVKKHREEKIPEPFPNRILGPTTRWETFYRQQDAFNYARSTAQDVHVFAFESETFSGGSGQRMYLAASYPVFWHYYSQLNLEKRHHYEVIPEGAVCKLYFDLEFGMEENPGRNGDRMTETLIEYVCSCLQSEFKVPCHRKQILDLDSSTVSKFSRHLIYLLHNVAFRDNVHVGRFVCYILSHLLDKVRRQRTAHSQERRDTVKCQVTESDLSNSFTVNNNSSSSTDEHKHESGQSETDTVCGRSDKTAVQDNKALSNEEAENEQHISCDRKKEVSSDISRILDRFSHDDLASLLVKNKNGDEVAFCDTGVYTKNRNFRLYQSSKLLKNRPLVLASSNQYMCKPVGDRQTDEQIFYDSLIANVQYSDKVRVLSFQDNSSAESRCLGRKGSSQKAQDAIDGYCRSPYPEVDDFIQQLVSQQGASGSIRHWTYFQQGELLLYEIARYKYCHNIGRQHRSNNIMYVADLKKGVYYQKCHDPDCQIQNFKSTEWSLPRDILPSHYFDTDTETDEMDLEIEDDEFLNATAELERQYLQTSHTGKEDELTLDDDDDTALLTLAEDIEKSVCAGGCS